MTKDNISLKRVTAGVICAAAFLHWQNYGIRATRYVYSHKELPSAFKGFRIVHISDFHNTALLTNKVASITAGEKPDIIAITGDLFDRRHTDIATGMALIDKLVKIAPIYYVRGNHEAKMENSDELTAIIKSKGVHVIENNKVIINHKGQSITLIGAPDPRLLCDEKDKQSTRNIFRSKLFSLTDNDSSFKVLLSHRPEFIHTYRDSGVKLALTGHAHGGQFGIPFTDYGVLVPNQGIFPPYAAGLKQIDDTTMIISRGIGNSAFPFRLFNRPEVVVIEFE